VPTWQGLAVIDLPKQIQSCGKEKCFKINKAKSKKGFTICF
jgi:hypothetical protein